MRELLDGALALAANGYPVFPLQPRSKLPYPGMRGFLDATIDTEQIRKWWSVPGAEESNIGLRPPPGVIVVDVDKRNGGLEALSALAAAGKELPSTLTVKTGGGGLHAFYTAPPDVSWPKVLVAGIDLKAENGYLVASPSVHESGARYEWIDVRPMVPAPAWLVALGRPKNETTRVTVTDEDEADSLPEETIAAVVAQLTPLFTEGRKHALSFAVAGWLRQRKWNQTDIVRVIEQLPSKNPRARVKDALDGYKATNDHGWNTIRQLVGEAPAAALDAATPNPKRAQQTANLEGFAAALANNPVVLQPQAPLVVPQPVPTTTAYVLPAHQASIMFDEQHEHDSVDAAIGALSCSTSVYQRGGLLVHVARDLSRRTPGVTRDKDAPRIAEIQTAYLRDELSRHSVWSSTSKKPIGVPARVVEAIRARDEWREIRALRGIAEFPIVRPDGAIVSVEGYDDATGVYVAPSCAVQLGDAGPAALAEWLLTELVGDFPFATPAHRAAWLAALLTPLARYAFEGPTPLILIDKNVRGSGGSLLADLVGLVVTGRALPRMSQALDETEENKRLLGLAVAGDPLGLIDNVNVPLGNGALDRALTGTSIKDRWLGGNKIVVAPWNCLLLATGNNIQVVGDTTRRALLVRLESPEERPEERSTFRHADLRRWVLAHRGWLLGSALGILSHHLRASSAPKPKPWGSFEGWSDAVRGAVIACGLADPCAGRDELVAVDSDADVARSLVLGVAALGANSEGSAKPVKELIAATQSAPLPVELEEFRDAIALLGTDAGKVDPRRVGNALRRYRGRVIGGRKLQSTDPRKTSGTARWFVGAA